MEAILEQSKVERHPAYKDSGVEWLGEVPAHWEVRKVTYVFNKIGSGTTPTAGVPKYYDDGEVNWLQTGDLTDSIIQTTSKKITKKAISDFSTLKSYPAGSLVIAMYGATIGKVGFLDIETTTNQACCVLANPNGFFTKFGFYLFMSAKSHIVSMSYGGGQPNISQDLVKSLRLPIPPLPEQTRIAAFLDRKTAQIDTAIAQKERLIELLKERRQIIILNAVTRGLNPNAPMKDSGVEWIGEVPVHWEVVKNHVLFEERNDSGSENLPILSVSIHSAVSTDEINNEDNIRGKIRIEDKSQYKAVKVNDIAFNMMRAWQGAIGAVRTDGMVSPAYIVGKNKGKVDSDYFEYQYRTEKFIQQMDRHSKGITDFRKRLYWQEFKNLLTIIPPLIEQKAIAVFIGKLNDKIATAIAAKQSEIEKLKELKSVLINSAVTGKIRV